MLFENVKILAEEIMLIFLQKGWKNEYVYI